MVLQVEVFFLFHTTKDMEASQSRALLPQSPYKKWTLKPYHIKYYWLIAVFLMMIAAIKVFINYATIQTSIAQVIRETNDINRHKQYVAIQAFVYRLPESEIFISRDNSILLPGDRIFVKRHNTTWTVAANPASSSELSVEDVKHAALSPFMSWITYFGDKMSR